MSESSTTDRRRNGIPVQPLIKSLPAVRCVYIGLLFVAALSSILFLYQLNYEIEPGVRFVSVPGNAVYVYIHLVRALIAAVLAWALHRYLRHMKAARNGEDDSEKQLAVSLARWWNLLAASAILALAFGVFSAVVQKRSAGQYSDVETYQSNKTSDRRVALRLAETQPQERLIERTVQHTGEQLWVYPEPLIVNEHIAEARASISQDGYPVVRLTFTPHGEWRIRQGTRENIGGRLAIEVDDQIVSAPVISAELGKYVVVDTGDDMEGATKLARELTGHD